MIEIVRNVLIQQQYKKIPSNVPFVTLYVRYEGSSARVIQLIDGRVQIRLTVQQFEVFCNKAESFIVEKGYEDVRLLSIVVTDLPGDARKFVLGNNKCWIADAVRMRLLIFDNQPEDFYGLKGLLEDAFLERRILTGEKPDPNDGMRQSCSEAGGMRDTYANGPKKFTEEFTPVNTAIVVINILVFVIMSIFGSTQDAEFMLGHGAMYAPAVMEDHEYYRFFTCMFMHFGFMHLMGNMTVLLFLGDNVERAVGKIKYVLIYILGGFIGSIGSFIYAMIYNKEIVSAGASGAIFAVIGALLWIVIRNKGRLENMTTLRVCVLIAYALYNGFISDNVDMAAHLFGLAGGFVLAFILYRKAKR